MYDTDQHKANHLQRYWLCYLAAGLGLTLHFGTALLRLSTFFPIPKLFDFSAFYASAVALHRDLSPYGLPTDWLLSLQTEMLIPNHPPAIYNPPLWPWLLQSLAVFRYPTAARVWLLINLSLLLWITLRIRSRVSVISQTQIEIKERGRILQRPLIPTGIIPPYMKVLFLYALISTFGPVFLDLSIGQTSILLLAVCLCVGTQLRTADNWSTSSITGLAIGLAAIAKLYPAAWLASLVFMRRWKQFIIGAVVTTAALCAGFLLLPDANREYWQHYLPQRLTSATDQVSIDDQSLLAWLDRFSKPQSFSVPGLQPDKRKQIVWNPLWELDQKWVQVGGYLLCAMIGIPIIYALMHSDESLYEGGFYLWVLYILAIFPHMERYNHALLLPAMFWLWQRDRQKLVLAVYILAGLSRLNHLWIQVLPVPWGPLASGFGLFAVLTLMWGILKEYTNHGFSGGRA